MEDRICWLLHGCLVNLLSHCSYCRVFYRLMVGTDSSGGQSCSSLNLVTSLPSSLYMSSMSLTSVRYCFAFFTKTIVESDSIDGLAWKQIVPEGGYRWTLVIDRRNIFISSSLSFFLASYSPSSISTSVSSESSPSWWGWWGGGGLRNKTRGQGLMAIARATEKHLSFL